MAPILELWTRLLSRNVTNLEPLYGPESWAVASAFSVLSETPWLEHVGEPWFERPGDSTAHNRIVVVTSWSEALTIFENRRYNVNGLLQAPCDLVDNALARSPELGLWWRIAREDVKRYIALSGIPDSLTRDIQDLLFEHLYEFVSMLFVEILASPEGNCTYFREQLTWFYSGHFPCGWDGDWPDGCMRVF